MKLWSPYIQLYDVNAPNKDIMTWSQRSHLINNVTYRENTKKEFMPNDVIKAQYITIQTITEPANL